MSPQTLSRNANKVRTTVLLPTKMRKEMLAAVLRDGYGMRGKSAWIAEAVDEFLHHEEWLASVGTGEGLTRSPEREVFSLTPGLKDRMEGAVLELRKRDPLMTGPQSAIIRAAITRRLLRSPK